MKFIIVAAVALLAVASAHPVDEKPTEIVRSTSDQKPDGGYEFSFELANGAVRTETGVVKELLNEENKPQKVVVVTGSYSYINPEGNEVSIKYTADEKGFQPEGSSIPVVPAAALVARR